MGISEQEHLRRMTNEKKTTGHVAKWFAIISALYFILMVFYGHPIGVLSLSGAIFVVSFTTWMKKRQLVRNYREQLAEITRN